MESKVKVIGLASKGRDPEAIVFGVHDFKRSPLSTERKVKVKGLAFKGRNPEAIVFGVHDL